MSVGKKTTGRIEQLHLIYGSITFENMKNEAVGKTEKIEVMNGQK